MQELDPGVALKKSAQAEWVNGIPTSAKSNQGISQSHARIDPSKLCFPPKNENERKTVYKPIWPDYFARRGQHDATNWHYQGYWSDISRVWRAYYSFVLLHPVKSYLGIRHFFRSLAYRVMGERGGAALSLIISLMTPVFLVFTPLLSLLAVGVAKIPVFRQVVPPLFHPFTYRGWVNYCVMLTLVFSWHGYKQWKIGLEPSRANRHSSKMFWNEFFLQNLPDGHYATEVLATVQQGKIEGELPEADLIIKPFCGGAGHRLRSLRWDGQSGSYRCDDPERTDNEAAIYTPDELEHYLRKIGVEMVVERWEKPRHPLPVCSLRILTLNVSGKSELICSAFLPAPDGSVSTAYFDLDTYVLNYEDDRIGEPLRVTSDGKYKDIHIPELSDVIKTCLDMHHKLPGHIEISWDVMLTEAGPVYLEGNVFPPGCDYKLSIFKTDESYRYLRDRVLDSA